MDPYDRKTSVGIALALLSGRGQRFHVTFEYGVDRSYALGLSEIDRRMREMTTRVEVDIEGRVNMCSDYEMFNTLLRASMEFLPNAKQDGVTKDDAVVQAFIQMIRGAYGKNLTQHMERLGLKLVGEAGALMEKQRSEKK